MPVDLTQDTDLNPLDDVDPEMVLIWRQKSPAERLAVSHAMWRFARDTLRNLLRAEHPEWSHEQVSREAARRLSRGTG